MAKRRYYRRNRRVSRRAFNKIAANYTKAKLDVAKRIILNNQQIRWDNPNATTVSFSDLIDLSPDYNMYRQLYLSFKLTGVSVSVVPMLHTANFAGASSVVLGMLTDNDGDGFANVVESDKSILLDFQNPFRRYWSFTGGSTGWVNIEAGEDFPGKFGVQVNDLPTAGEAYWTVKFTFYLLMKNKG